MKMSRRWGVLMPDCGALPEPWQPRYFPANAQVPCAAHRPAGAAGSGATRRLALRSATLHEFRVFRCCDRSQQTAGRMTPQTILFTLRTLASSP